MVGQEDERRKMLLNKSGVERIAKDYKVGVSPVFMQQLDKFVEFKVRAAATKAQAARLKKLETL